MDYTKFTYSLICKSETRLYAQNCIPHKDYKAVICIIHGIGEHSGRYEHWYKLFCDNNIAVISFDLRGHGLSEGKKGTIAHITDFWDDIDCVITQTDLGKKRIPFFIYGHSMGGNVALSYVANNKDSVTGIIVSSPWLSLTNPLPSSIDWLVQRLDRVFPHLTFRNGIKSSQLVSDSQEIINRKNDKLVHPFISIRLYNQMQESAKKLMAAPHQINIPLLVLHGESDQVTNPRASKEFASRAPNATYIGYPNGLHELQNGPNSHMAFNDITTWIDQQTSAQ
ncbi:MAG: alpha/beta hydrolase [Breznakibacter sp.]